MSLLEDTITEIARLADLDADWDEDGARPVAARAIAAALDIARDVARLLPDEAPDVAPHPDGGVGLSWPLGENLLWWIVRPDGHVKCILSFGPAARR